MPQCPVCQTEYIEEPDRKYQNCCKCAWCLTLNDRDRGFSIFGGQQIPEIYKLQVENWAKLMWQGIELKQEQSAKYEQEAREYRHKYENLFDLKSDYKILQIEIQQLKQQLEKTKQNRQELLQGVNDYLKKEKENINQFKSEIKQENIRQLRELETRLLKTINEKFKVNNSTSLPFGDKKEQPQITDGREEQHIDTELKTDSATNLSDEEIKIVESYNSNLDLSNLFDLFPVSPTKDSINQRRSGTITTYFEEDNRLGNYVIITGENGQYLLPKHNFRITTHNLESLMHFFQSDREIDTEEIKSFILIKPGIVFQKSSQSQWQLIDRGLIELIPNREGGGSEN